MIDLDPNLVTAGSNSGIALLLVFLMSHMKRFIGLWQTAWEHATDQRLTDFDKNIAEIKKDGSERKSDFADLKKAVMTSLLKMESQVEELMRILPVISALKGFIEATNKRLTSVESLKTEVVQLSEEVRLLRNKK